MSVNQANAVSELLQENWGLSSPVAAANILWPTNAYGCDWDYSGKRTAANSRLQREPQANKLMRLAVNVTWLLKNLSST